MSEKLDHEFAEINRKYVHKNSDFGYNDFTKLLLDFSALVGRLPFRANMSEYWVRAASDLASYAESWPHEIDDDDLRDSLLKFEEKLVKMMPYLTQTQKTRLNSAVLRLRSVMVHISDKGVPPVFEHIISASSESLTL